jgi:hypothetical protein
MMGHGFPIDSSSKGNGQVSFGVVDADVSGAYHIAQFWGIEL